jgi:hypothetical protein
VGQIDFLGRDFYLKLSMPCKTRGFVDIKTTNKHVKTRKYTRVLVRQSHFFTSRRSDATREFSRKPDRKPALSPALATIPEMTAVIIGYASVTNMVARSGHICAQMNYRSHASSTAALSQKHNSSFCNRHRSCFRPERIAARFTAAAPIK